MKLMKTNLQYFADPDPDGKSKSDKTYTQEDVNKMMAAKAHEVEQSHESEWQKQQDELKAKYLKEGENRAQMTAEEKAKAALDDERQAFQQEQADFAKQQEAQKRKDALAATRELLSSKGLPTTFAETLTDIDPQQRQTNVDAFEKTFTGAVDQEISERSKGKRTPQGGNSGPAITTGGEITRKEFESMKPAERMDLYRSDKELYQKLKGSN
ncbi:DUF4355 domain-containing protein [Levilactobacillus brevis]|uniref:DUF4355 domain-containing protein n=1 Tax=Levilactobacillus brevis TaxID=1580 RepID=UPI000847F37E|nr:DUF4355 domain-containing protein [Levilactobacillus brevis]ODP95379.1 hypothetical protein BGC39_13875 [Levilactobacillus brevis]